MREKGWEERGPKAHSKNSDFGTPLIYVLFSGLPKGCDPDCLVQSPNSQSAPKSIEEKEQVPPGTKPIHAGKILGELIFARIHAGPVFAFVRIQENISEGSFSAY